MRFILVQLLAIGGAIGALSALGFEREDAQVFKEFVFLIEPSKDIQAGKYAPPAKLAPGVTLYDQTGEQIGTVDALTKRDGEVVTVWAQQLQIPGERIFFKNGIAVYSKDENAGQYAYGSANAAPY